MDIILLQRDLRLIDNPALFHGSKKEITALYMFTIKIIGSHMEDLPDN